MLRDGTKNQFSGGGVPDDEVSFAKAPEIRSAIKLKVVALVLLT